MLKIKKSLSEYHQNLRNQLILVPRIVLKIKNNNKANNNNNNKSNNKNKKINNNKKLINTRLMIPISPWKKFLNLLRMKIHFIKIKLATNSHIILLLLLDLCNTVLEVAVAEDIQDTYTTSIFNHQAKLMSLKIFQQTTCFSKDMI